MAYQDWDGAPSVAKIKDIKEQIAEIRKRLDDVYADLEKKELPLEPIYIRLALGIGETTLSRWRNGIATDMHGKERDLLEDPRLSEEQKALVEERKDLLNMYYALGERRATINSHRGNRENGGALWCLQSIYKHTDKILPEEGGIRSLEDLLDKIEIHVHQG